MKRFEALTEPTGETPDPYEKRRLPMANRKRNIQMKFYVTEEEKWLIDGKMAQLPTRRYGAYLRKMAIDGYVVKLDLPELRDMVSLLKRSSSNLNQIAKRVNETSRIYAADIECLLENQERLWSVAKEILGRLSNLR